MKRLIVSVVCIFLLFAGISFWWRNGTAAANPSDTSTKIFVVNKGEGIRAVANNLKQVGLIKDPVVFFLLVRKQGLDQKIQAGDFRLSPSMSAQAVAENLTHGTLDIWITIPEGKRAEEIADILKEKTPSYQESWRAQLDANEGYLFPDTYLIPRDAAIDQIVKLMTDTFAQKYTTISNSTALHKEQIVILASLIEREARHASDRSLVSSVIHNRLQNGMAIDIDASVQYALGYDANEKTWWKKNLTVDDLAITSPYNTYKHPGLPPTPIANPGILALQAAANPADTNYLFYMTDKNGINHYALTNAEHNANIRKYGL